AGARAEALRRRSRVRRRVAVVQDQQVAVRVAEVRLVADAAVERLAFELDAQRLEPRLGLLDVVDPQRDRAVARLDSAAYLPHLHALDRDVPRLELTADPAAVALRALQPEHTAVELLGPIEVRDRQEDEFGLPDERFLSVHRHLLVR